MKKQNATTLFQSTQKAIPLFKNGERGERREAPKSKRGDFRPKKLSPTTTQKLQNENSQGVFLVGIAITVELAGILIVF